MLAIGAVSEDEMFIWSVLVADGLTHQQIVDALELHGGDTPEQVLCIQNDAVIDSFNVGD